MVTDAARGLHGKRDDVLAGEPLAGQALAHILRAAGLVGPSPAGREMGSGCNFRRPADRGGTPRSHAGPAGSRRGAQVCLLANRRQPLLDQCDFPGPVLLFPLSCARPHCAKHDSPASHPVTLRGPLARCEFTYLSDRHALRARSWRVRRHARDDIASGLTRSKYDGSDVHGVM